MNEYEEAKYEKRMDDARDAEIGDKWAEFKSGLDWCDEMREFLGEKSKAELIYMILEAEIDFNEELDDWLRDVYQGKW